MLNDIKNAKDTQKDFDDLVKNKSMTLPCEFSILVLTQGSWPKIEMDIPVQVPKELETVKDLFEANYIKSFHGRKLIWHMD